MDKQVKEAASELAEGVKAIYGPKLVGIFLFGSQARDTAAEESDVDSAIVLDDFESPWQEVKHCSELRQAVALQYGVAISLYFLRKREWIGKGSLVDNIHREGVRL